MKGQRVYAFVGKSEGGAKVATLLVIALYVSYPGEGTKERSILICLLLGVLGMKTSATTARLCLASNDDFRLIYHV